ncbi:MAG TPA: P-loop NTPase [Microthrixaceae bacterium]|nr:P-loop NTPase [Microthrixaceae bacterium]
MSEFLMTDGHLDPSPPGESAPTSAPSVASQTVHASVVVVESHDPTRERLLALLGDSVTPFATIEELTTRLTGTVPVVVVLGPSCSNGDVLAIAERVVAQYPMVGTILVVDELSTSLLQQALRAGVRDVLALTGEAAALAQAVRRVAASLEQPARSAATTVATTDSTPTGASVAAPGPAAMETVNGQVLTVFSTKGGAGKSVLATSLAVTLAQRSDKPVCLVDADLQFGDVAVMLKLTPHHTIVDAVSVLDRMDSALLESLLVTHEPSGLRVMPAPLEPAFADQVGAAEMVQIVEMLRTFCAYVIVDTPAYFNDVVLGLVEVSDRVMLVAGMDIPNIKNVKIGLQTLRLLNTPMEKLLLVLNRANSKVKLDIGEVERTLQLRADALIPSDVVVPQSVNKGEPVVLHTPKSGVSKSIQQLADKFLPAEQRRRR